MTSLPLSSDDIVKLTAVALMIAHIGVLVWSGWLRKGIAPVIALNLLISASVTIDWTRRLSDLEGSIELVWVFVGFELAVLLTSLLAVFRVRVPQAVIWTAFVAHGLMTGAALLFMLTFHLTRLI